MSDRFCFHEFGDRDQLDASLANAVGARLGEALQQRQSASLVLSGGSTPLPFFRVLSAYPLDWSKVTVTLADDRWVGTEHEDSNERSVRENLLRGDAATAQFVSLVSEDRDAGMAIDEIASRLSVFDTFDVVILGMGGDGHTASLFPESDALTLGLSRDSGLVCQAVTPSSAKHQRMTMTLPRLIDTRSLFLHITGIAKRAVLESADAGQAILPALPIAAFIESGAQPTTRNDESSALEVYWSP